MKRRSLIRGAALGAGAAFLAPLMNRLVRADEAGSCRFVFVVEGNGYEPVTVLPDSVRAALDATMDEPIGSKRWWYRDYQHDSPIVMDTPDMDSARALGALGREGLIDQTTVLLGLSCLAAISKIGHASQHRPGEYAVFLYLCLVALLLIFLLFELTILILLKFEKLSRSSN